MSASIVEAVGRAMHGLSADDRAAVAHACGVSVPTVYQWGETDPNGEPRMRIPACKIAHFCAAVGNTIVMDAILTDVREAMAGTRPGERHEQPTLPEACASVVALANSVAIAFSDGIYAPDESRSVQRAMNEAAEALRLVNPKTQCTRRRGNGNGALAVMERF